jgi:hypothetical protein
MREEKMTMIMMLLLGWLCVWSMYDLAQPGAAGNWRKLTPLGMAWTLFLAAAILLYL